MDRTRRREYPENVVPQPGARVAVGIMLLASSARGDRIATTLHSGDASSEPPTGLATSRSAGEVLVVAPPRPESAWTARIQPRYSVTIAVAAGLAVDYLPLASVSFTNGTRNATGRDLQYASVVASPLYFGLSIEARYILLNGGIDVRIGSYIEGRVSLCGAVRVRQWVAFVGPSLRYWDFEPPRNVFLPEVQWRGTSHVDLGLETGVRFRPGACARGVCGVTDHALTLGVPVTGGGLYVLYTLGAGVGHR